MGSDMRKVYIGTILCSLIEKSNDVKVLKAITKMIEEWVKSKSTIAMNQGPNIKEKSILLVKMMQFIEKRFPNDLELNGQFLELVHYVYKDESLKGTELTSKLEPAFMAGLRCVQPQIRAKFFEVFDNSIRRRLHDRLLYILCSQNWENIGPHFWIKQCIELLLVTAVEGASIQCSTPSVMLPAMTAVYEQADSQEKADFVTAVLNIESMDISVEPKEEEIDIEMPSADDANIKADPSTPSQSSDAKQTVQALISKQLKFYESLSQMKTIHFLDATAQLCHLDTALAQYLWIQLFPRLWKIFTEKQQTALSNEIVAFVTSGIHVPQKDCHPSALGTFIEGITCCVPPIPMKPLITLYQGKSHNLWHRACLTLEQICFDKGYITQAKSKSGSERTDLDDTLDMLSEMYTNLKEEDLWGGLWQKRAKFIETNTAIALEQQGMFLQALDAYDQVCMRLHQDVGVGLSPSSMNSEANLFWNHSIRCNRELNDWNALMNMGSGGGDPNLILEASWRRQPNWNTMKEALEQVLWLLTYDDKEQNLSEALDKHSVGVPPLQWLPWVPQLLTCLIRPEGKQLLNIISHVGRAFPQAVYFPIRTLYLILKIEQRQKSDKANNSKNSNAAVAGPIASTPNSPAISLGDSSNTSATASESVTKATQPMWRCSRIMHMQRDIHPTILSCLEGIVDQMVWFRENVYEEVLRQLRQALAKCYAVAYENACAVAEATVTPHTLNFVKKLVSTFGIGVENVSSVSTPISSSISESLARRAQATAQDPVFQKMKGQFTADFDFSVPGAMKLHNLINKLKKWIKILEGKTKLLPKSFLIEEKCRFLNNFSQHTADIEIPGEFLLLRVSNHSHYFVRISRFMPRVDIVQKHNTAARRLYIKGHNGKIYPYLVVNDACLSDARREERVLQLLRMLNHYLGKQKETSKRFLNFTIPRVVPVSPQMRLVEDNESSISLLDIYKQRCAKRSVEYDAPLQRFYERLATVQARVQQASHQVLRDILKDVQNIMVSKTLLKDWAEQTYSSASDYWTFRKQFTLQLALAGFIEYVLHLTRLNPDMMYIHQDSGLMNISYFRFNIEDSKGEFEANRPVPFRLTPNIAEFITAIGVCGPMTSSMIATARCLAMPNFKVSSLLRAILRDEMFAWYKKRYEDPQSEGQSEADGAIIIQMVTKAVNLIVTRLQSLATFDGSAGQVNTLVAAANSPDNLCRMDPAWHPWL
ncbi:hypothetical protein CDAR_3771 [Caerostris darwini]|uniref:Transformation/transcription domain-associated protein n=1 Tax=Caerostris darwini TaxID=1538125 RepID=A0AAV4TJI0_9ARAC|nr:hypothetical protein CDAR_3771 [Caerostris darwini]